jgi:LysM repeat protein
MGRHSAPVPDHSTARRVGTVATLAGSAVLAPVVAGVIPQADADTLDVIAHCESGGNPLAKNPSSSASGLFQIVNGTWAAYGGLQFAPTARSATAAQQRIVAERILAAEGTSPWNPSKSCWAGKTGIPAPAPLEHSKPVIVPKVAAPAKQVVVHEAVRPMAASTYVVVRGDTLSKIAHRFGVTVRDLYNANHAVIGGNPNLIFPNQRLVITGTVAVGQHSAPTQGVPQHAALMTDPLPGHRISSHEQGVEVDLAAPMNAPIYSAAAGRVEFTGKATGFGGWIVITSVIDGQTYDIVYGHEYLDGIFVKPGETVHAGELIGKVGKNGNASGPHVCLGVWQGGRVGGHTVDPVAFFAAHGVRL